MADYDPKDGLLKPDRPVGIVGYGAYVPRYRLPATECRACGKGARAARPSTRRRSTAWMRTWSPCRLRPRATRWRAQIDPREIRAVWVGSESHPYAVKPSSTIVAEAIGAVPNDAGGRLGVRLQGGHRGDAGGDGLCRLRHGQVRPQHRHGHGPGRPGDALEYTAAAGGAAILIGPGAEAVAVINGSFSFVTDTPDFWRREHANYPSHGDRFTGEPAYFKHVTGAAERLMEAAGHDGRRLPLGRFPPAQRQVPGAGGQVVGFQQEQIKPGLLSGRIGNTYSGSTMIGLTAILDVAEPGDRILMVSYGSGAGSDAFELVNRPPGRSAPSGHQHGDLHRPPHADRLRDVHALSREAQAQLGSRGQVPGARGRTPLPLTPGTWPLVPFCGTFYD
jgi:hydroxymethylglutaryl-CoA synthase